MNHLKPRNDFAIEKVRVFCPPIREKNVLMAIAGHAKHDGTGTWCALTTIVHETGLSKATVCRHIAKLEELKMLTRQRGGHGTKDTTRYTVPMCALALQELEVLTGVSGRQLVLPIAHDESRSDVTVGEIWRPIGVGTKPIEENHWLKELESHRETLQGITVRHSVSQGETQTLPKPSLQPGLGLIHKEKQGKGSGKALNQGYDTDREIGGPISEKTRNDIAQVLEKLRMGSGTRTRTLPGAGTRLREKLFGAAPRVDQEEIAPPDVIAGPVPTDKLAKQGKKELPAGLQLGRTGN